MFLSQIVYTKPGQPIVKAFPPTLVIVPSVPIDADLAAEAQPPRQRAVLDIDTLDAILREFS